MAPSFWVEQATQALRTLSRPVPSRWMRARARRCSTASPPKRSVEGGRTPRAELGGMQKIVFVGINSLFSAAHLCAVGRAFKVSAVVETIHRLGRLKRL